MMTVERFKYSEMLGSWDLRITDDGDLVDYADYMKLVAENEALKAEIYTLKNPVSSLINHVIEQRRMNDDS